MTVFAVANAGPWWAYWLLIITLALVMVAVYYLHQVRQRRLMTNGSQIVCFKCDTRITAENASPQMISAMAQMWLEQHPADCQGKSVVMTHLGRWQSEQ